MRHTPFQHQFRVVYLLNIRPPPNQRGIPPLPRLKYTFIFVNPIADPYNCTSLLYTCTPHFQRIIRVESWPPTTPQPTQCSGHNCHCGHQSFGLLFPDVPCPSPVNFYTPALNLSYNGFTVVFSPPAHSTFLLNNVPFYHSINDYLITECPPAVCPPPNPLALIQGCITAYHTSTA
ncbi:hypothetical protein Tsp_03539 [Trichinella spiralis]|uniref:hypothetical protein n=1 Tax=Trichinella spiralis TaxID=6334 RepID=UPI0001EFB625|nr:hypothetical protein Tsp_03539 [Trichinella spiralis]